jgi:hypothetical protein
MTMPPITNLGTVGGVRELLLGEQAAWTTRDTAIAVEDSTGIVRRISGFARREPGGTETFVLTLGEPVQ